jgi:hypothetical protein
MTKLTGHGSNFLLFRLVIMLSMMSATPEVNSQVAYLSLDDQRLHLYSNNFIVDSVIDARNQDGCIGFVLKGSGSKQTAAYFERPFCAELQDLFSRSLPEEDNNVPLIIRINKLLLSEYKLGYSAFNIVEINISFIIFRDEKYYEIFQGFTSTDDAGLSNSGSSVHNITEAISCCFNDFISHYRKGILEYKQIDETNLATNALDHQTFKIEQVKDTLRGIFYSFSDFLNYQVDTTNPFTLEYIPGKGNLPGTTEASWLQNNSKIENVWGFSDGHLFYIRLNDHYYPLYQQNGHFRAKALKAGPSFEDLSPIIAAGIFGGIIGAAFGVMIIPSATIEKAHAIECQLDLNTGLVLPINFLVYKEMNSRMILYLSRYLKEDAIMEVYVDGEYRCKLTRNSYYFLTIPPDKKQVELCLKSNQDEFCETISPLPYVSEAYICKVKEGHVPVKEEAKLDVRKDILQKIENGEITRACPTY